MKPSLHGLYAITDSALLPNDAILVSAVEQALKGGAEIIQYRDKSKNSAQRLRQAKALVSLGLRYKKPIIINDDIELALTSNATGVHLGQGDANIKDARAVLGPDAIIGVTCHDQLSLAVQAANDGADYIAFGAFFPSSTKPSAQPASLEIIQQAKSQLSIPIVAIGGISVDNAHQVITAGANMVAVVHALFGHDQIDQQAQRFQQLF